MRRIRSTLARLLVLACVPLLIVTTPNVAQAAGIVQSSGVEWDIGGLSIGGFGSLECDATVTSTTYPDAVDLSVQSLSCLGGPDASPGFSQPGEPGSSYVVWVQGTSCGGSTSGTFGTGEDDGLWMVHGYVASAGSWEAGPPTCDPASICLKVDGAGSIRQGCSPVELDPVAPEGPTGACDQGQPTQVAIGGSGNGTATITMDTSKAAGVARYWVYSFRQPTNPGTVAPGHWVSFSGQMGTLTSVASGSAISVVIDLANYPITGVQVSLEGSPPPGYTGFNNTRSQSGTTAGGYMEPVTATQSYGGISDPQRCRFFFGEKLVDFGPTITADEPYSAFNTAVTGTVGVPPTYDPGTGTEQDGCVGFSWTDPATWGGAASCMMVALLNQIVDVIRNVLGAIRGLAAAIVGGILGGLSALFVPEDLPDWGDIPSPLPGGWLPDMPSLGGASCGGLTMPQISLGFNDWTVGPVTFADTCDDPWPLIRTFTYNGTLVLVLVSAVWMAFRAVASGLGMGVPTSGGSDDD